MAKTVSSREATIGRSARVRGRISGDGDLLVEGVVEGDIALGGDLTVADGGSVQTVEARTVTVRGEVSCDIRASGEVHIETGSRVRGDVQGLDLCEQGEIGVPVPGRRRAQVERRGPAHGSRRNW